MLLLLYFYCVILSKIWIKVYFSHLSDTLKNLEEFGYFIEGHRETSNQKLLKKLFNRGAIFDGMYFAFLTIFADFFGVIGLSTGISFIVSIIISFYDEINKLR